QVLAEHRAGLGNLSDRGADSLRDRHPSPVEVGAGAPRTPAETDRAAQLLLQRLQLRPQAVCSSEIVVPLRLLQLSARLRQALAIGAPRLVVEDLTGVAQASDDTFGGIDMPRWPERGSRFHRVENPYVERSSRMQDELLQVGKPAHVRQPER